VFRIGPCAVNVGTMTAFDSAPVAEAIADAPDSADARPQPDWVFGYGSLIWDPGFDFHESRLAQVHGYHRTFCIRSTRYRGTPERPGVVLGLDRGGSCIGMAFRLRPETRHAAVDALYEREMTGGVYVARLLSCVLGDGQRVQALAFVANRDSASYERLDDDQIVRRLSGCCGQRGHNRDYALRTWRSLADHGVHCPHLGRVGRRLLASGCE
jgi:cation transport protein ChaC